VTDRDLIGDAQFVPFYSFAAQRPAAQPLGRFRFVIIILAGKLKSESVVFSLSLGLVG
jgi:hypothetical protein